MVYIFKKLCYSIFYTVCNESVSPVVGLPLFFCSRNAKNALFWVFLANYFTINQIFIHFHALN